MWVGLLFERKKNVYCRNHRAPWESIFSSKDCHLDRESCHNLSQLGDPTTFLFYFHFLFSIYPALQFLFCVPPLLFLFPSTFDFLYDTGFEGLQGLPCTYTCCLSNSTLILLRHLYSFRDLATVRHFIRKAPGPLIFFSSHLKREVPQSAFSISIIVFRSIDILHSATYGSDPVWDICSTSNFSMPVQDYKDDFITLPYNDITQSLPGCPRKRPKPVCPSSICHPQNFLSS